VRKLYALFDTFAHFDRFTPDDSRHAIFSDAAVVEVADDTQPVDKRQKTTSLVL